MFAKLRQLLKESVIYGLGTIAARAVNFLLLPYYSHLMTTEEYGIYALFMLLVAFLQPVYIHGMDIAYLRYSADANRGEQKKHLGSMLVHSLITGGAITIALFLFAPAVSRLFVSDAGALGEQLTRIAAIIILVDTLGAHIYNWLRINNRAAAFSTIRTMNVAVNIGLNILFVGVFGWGVLGAFWAFLGASTAVLIALAVLAWRDITLGWSWPMVKEWMIFGLPNLPSQLFMIAIEFSDRKWIELYMGLDDAGIYSAGYRVAMLMSMIAQAFRYAWQPFFLKTAKDADAKPLFARVLTYYILFTGWIWIFCAFFLPTLLKIPIPGIGENGQPGHLINAAYWAGFQIVPIVMLAHVFNGIYANLMVGVYLEKKTKIIPVAIGAAAVVNIAGNGLLIPIYGYMAAAWLTVVSYVVMTVILFSYIRRKYHVPYEWSRIIRIAATVGAFYGIAQPFDGIGGMWLRIGILLFLPLLWWYYILNDEERDGVTRRLG
ncbi:oligosaccharide flippase family protein [bacterium]|nr:oligosaccharide flippase family protein [bacterium]